MFDYSFLPKTSSSEATALPTEPQPLPLTDTFNLKSFRALSYSDMLKDVV